MDRPKEWTASISRQDWTLDRRGAQDEARHNEKVKEAIQGNLGNVISDGDIITADPHSKKIIKVPLKSLELPRFVYGQGKEGVSVGDGSEQPGDVIGIIPKGGQGGQGPGAGQEQGVEYYEAEITIEELQDLVFSDLGLPRVKPKEKHDMETERLVFNDVRKNRSANNLDLARTALQNIMRNAQETGKAELHKISPDDYRVRTWEEEKRPENNAVVIAMADISGSMGESEKYITRAFCWWTVNFLRSKYPKVEIVFVAHDTVASEVSEEQFFTRGTGGGTKCSSANKLARDIIDERYPPSRYNVYPLHFSDGDNWSDDNPACVDLVRQLLDREVNQYAYIQIGATSQSKLLSEYTQSVKDKRFKGLIINDKQGVLPALKEVFNPEEQAA